MSTEEHKETASQKYRRELKENPELHAAHLQREKARDSERRKVMKMKMETDIDLKILARIRSKERMQATRKRRKEEHVKQTSTRYSSPRTLGKAVAKIKRNQPPSPTKAVEVVKKIASEFNITVLDKNDAPKAAPRKLTDKGKKLICDFYNRDDISRQMPGIKDVKTVKSNTGTKMRIQKRTMIMSIREALEIFKESHIFKDGEVRVQFMTTVDGKRFTEIYNDIADVQFDDIIAILETPKKKTDRNNSFTEFLETIDVFEKK